MTREHTIREWTGWTARVGLLVAVAGMTACVGHYRALRPASEIEQIAPLERSLETLPRTTIRVAAGEAGGETFHLAMEEIGTGSRDSLVVLVHGVVSDRRMWRYLAGDLGSDHDLLLVDLPGCGDSDRPDPAVVGPGAYGPTAMARTVLLALRARLERGARPRRIALVGHSLGGAVILRMTGDPELRSEFEDVLARVDQVVLLSPMDFSVEKVHPGFAKIVKLGRTKVGLASLLGLLKNEVGRTTRIGVDDPYLAIREEANRMIEILRHRTTRRAAQAMLVNAIPFDLKERRPDWERIEELVADYANVDFPVLILWGERDETLPVSMGYKLQSQLPRAWLRVVEHSMHSLAAERPRLCAELIRRFLRSGGRGWVGVAEVTPGERIDESIVRVGGGLAGPGMHDIGSP